jgi:hypothetical protein
MVRYFITSSGSHVIWLPVSPANISESHVAALVCCYSRLCFPESVSMPSVLSHRSVGALGTYENGLLRGIFGQSAGSDTRMKKTASLHGFPDRIKADEIGARTRGARGQIRTSYKILHSISQGERQLDDVGVHWRIVTKLACK